MSCYRRANVAGGTYFFTVVTYRRRAFLLDEDVRRALREGIGLAREAHPFSVDAWVLLPDHLHCVWTLPPGDANFALRWVIIKRHVTRCCGKRLHLAGLSRYLMLMKWPDRQIFNNRLIWWGATRDCPQVDIFSGLGYI